MCQCQQSSIGIMHSLHASIQQSEVEILIKGLDLVIVLVLHDIQPFLLVGHYHSHAHVPIDTQYIQNTAAHQTSETPCFCFLNNYFCIFAS